MEKKLRLLKERIERNGNSADLDIVNELLKEDVDGGAGAVGGVGTNISGMGSVVNSQPSSFPGALNGNAWINGGGTSGSGDISVPYNPGGGNRMFQQIPSPIKKKSAKMKKAGKSKENTTNNKLMKFSSFVQDEMSKVTKVKE